jgi:histidyl-tRNA synthetase
MAKENGPMSGFRDLLAEQMIPRQEMLDTVRGVYETYGFVPLKTPALERLETMTGKYGDEGEKLMYRFKDNGGRDVAMRYDQTVPLARVVAQYGGELPTPYKRYALGEVWRGESPQAGRYREFTQFDADTVGTDSYLADTEIIAMMSDSMSALELNTIVRVNDRRILDGLAIACGIHDDSEFRALIGIIDKIDKIGSDSVVAEVAARFNNLSGEKVEAYLGLSGEGSLRLGGVVDVLSNKETDLGVESLTKVMGALSVAGYREAQITFDQTIARGLDYYTSTVYETTLLGAEEIGSVCSGGRFDNLIEAMGGPSTPAVGTSIGVDRLLEGMRRLGKLGEPKTKTEVFIASMDEDLHAERFALVQKLRRAGVAAELFFGDNRLGKQFKSIEKLGVSKVLIYGENEHERGVIQVKDLLSREQEEIDREDIVNVFGGGVRK